ncbi:hypothetical protein GCM10020358_14080 [Amorphoplanes nipponensis]
MRLRRALLETGRPYRCAACGIGDDYNGRPLVLHVDHIDGRPWDCRAHNVRFLCPNCHSQTPTFAGRQSRQNPHALVRVDDQGNLTRDGSPHEPLAEEQILDILARVGRREISSGQAARLMGCTKITVYRMRRRLAERGSVGAQRRPPVPPAIRQAVVRLALARPDWGPREIVTELGRRQPDPITVPVRTVGNVLARAGLGSREARSAAAGNGENHLTV